MSSQKKKTKLQAVHQEEFEKTYSILCNTLMETYGSHFEELQALCEDWRSSSRARRRDICEQFHADVTAEELRAKDPRLFLRGRQSLDRLRIADLLITGSVSPQSQERIWAYLAQLQAASQKACEEESTTPRPPFSINNPMLEKQFRDLAADMEKEGIAGNTNPIEMISVMSRKMNLAEMTRSLMQSVSSKDMMKLQRLGLSVLGGPGGLQKAMNLQQQQQQ